MGSVVPYTDNYFVGLNAAVFTDGSFVFIPKGVKCPMELSTYFRINTEGSGQFERTLIVAEEGALCQLSGRLHGAQVRHEPAPHVAVSPPAPANPNIRANCAFQNSSLSLCSRTTIPLGSAASRDRKIF